MALVTCVMIAFSAAVRPVSAEAWLLIEVAKVLVDSAMDEVKAVIAETMAVRACLLSYLWLML